MNDILTSLFYLLRPVLSMEAGYRYAGVDLFDIVTLGMMSALSIKWLIMVVSGSARPLSKIDLGIIFYCLWVLSISLVYVGNAVLSEVFKFILPMFSYIVFKSLIRNRVQYIRYLFLLLVGSLVPVFLSGAMILQGEGLKKVNYWTGLERYEGVFTNTHNFGHSMTFVLMLSAVYVWFIYVDRNERDRVITRAQIVFLSLLISVAVFDLYMSYVRTAWLGLLIFLWVFLYKYRKKVAILFAVAMLAIVFVAQPILKLVFHDIVEVTQGERDIERIGSGRPYIWSHNLNIFSDLTFDRQLAGVGVGNRGHILTEGDGLENVWNSHNDFLEVMMQTGLIGLLLFLFIQLQILFRIYKLQPMDKLVFFALFIAVTAMNLASNSYVVRFSIGQMYYMLLAYIESSASYKLAKVRNKSDRDEKQQHDNSGGIFKKSAGSIVTRKKMK